MPLTPEQEQEIREQLKLVVDPELFIDIVNLGLIYAVQMDDTGQVQIDMTLTSPGCPLGPQIEEQVKTVLSEFPWINGVHVNWVWSPPWNHETMASEDARLDLGIW